MEKIKSPKSVTNKLAHWFNKVSPRSLTTKVLVGCAFFMALGSANAMAADYVTIGGARNAAVAKLLPEFNMRHDRKLKLVVLSKDDGSARAYIQIMPAVAHLSNTKEYAQNVMDSYAGWGLTAQVARRGFSFSYVDNAPCTGLVSYFDGSSYLMFGACGLISKDELFKAYSIAKRELDLEEILSRTATPNVYY